MSLVTRMPPANPSASASPILLKRPLDQSNDESPQAKIVRSSAQSDAASACRAAASLGVATPPKSNPVCLLNVEHLPSKLAEQGIPQSATQAICEVAQKTFQTHLSKYPVQEKSTMENSHSECEESADSEDDFTTRSAFYDIDENQYPGLPKMQIFCTKGQKKLHLYIQMPTPISDGEEEVICGVAKQFFKAMHLYLTPTTLPCINWAAKLVRIHDSDYHKAEFEDEVGCLELFMGNKYVAQILHADIATGVMYSRLANKGSLEMFFQDNPDFTYETKPAEFLSLLIDMLKGLDALWENDTVHRDLCEKNILIHQLKSGKLRAQITDFGTSLTTSDCEDDLGVCQPFSPERITSRFKLAAKPKPLTKHDVWAMGCIFYWMLFRCDVPWGSLVLELVELQKEIDERTNDLTNNDSTCSPSANREEQLAELESLYTNASDQIKNISLPTLIAWRPPSAEQDALITSVALAVCDLRCSVDNWKGDKTLLKKEKLVIEKLISIRTLLKDKLDQAWSYMHAHPPSDPLQKLIVEHMLHPDKKQRLSAKKLIPRFKKFAATRVAV